MPETTGTQAIDRAAQLLVRVVESAQPPSIGELAARAGLPKSTTSRLVSALERQGLVQRLGDRGRLTAGPVLLRYANRDVSSTLVELAAPSLRRLADASGETINLAVPGVDGVEHLAQEDTAHFVGVTDWVGRKVPLRARRERQGLPRLRDAGADSSSQQVRARGYATSIDELEVGLTALAAPVFGAARRSARRALHLRAHRPPDLRPHRAARAASDRRGDAARGAARPPRPHARCRMTHEEILKGLYDNTLIGNAPEVKDLTEQGARRRTSSPSRCSTTR